MKRKNPSKYKSGEWVIFYRNESKTYLYERKISTGWKWTQNYAKVKRFKTGLSAKRTYNTIWQRMNIPTGSELGYSHIEEFDKSLYYSTL